MQVVVLDLQCNKLGEVPPCILELPCLSELNLSHNRLSRIPDVKAWSPLLSTVDLSHNSLDHMPADIAAPAIKCLNISHNKFHTVPAVICSFKTLRNLDVSYNQNILTLPEKLGKLKKLAHLKLEGLKFLTDPPKSIQSDTQACVYYLRSKHGNARGFYHMKLMLVGCANRGKTTLVARLHNKDCGNESTVGANVSEWSYKAGIGKKPFSFSIWDFGGQEEYYTTHQCFLSQHSLYLLVFNLTHGEAGVLELKPWLSNIALRAPKSCVIIVGTHLDKIDDENREEMYALLQKVQQLASTFENLSIAEIIPVGLKDRIEKIGYLKEAIYTHAENYQSIPGHRFMGQQIPASYLELYRQLQIIQQSVRDGLQEPIMHEEQFKQMIQNMNIPDIQDLDEVKAVTMFLTDVGALLHYDDQRHNLHELYFVDPNWLCGMMAKVITIRERNPFVKNGILRHDQIPLLFKDKKFPWQYFKQYITLLDRFEVALALDNRRVLIPSLLDDDKPPMIHAELQETLYKRLLFFGSASTPPGFWSRLLSRIIHSVPQVRSVLARKALPTEHQQDRDSESPGPHLDSKLTPHLKIGSPDFNLELSSAVTPNVTPSFQIDDGSCFDLKDVELHYWRTGLLYSDPDVTFRIEAIAHDDQEDLNGILIAASLNTTGKKIIGQLVDLTISVEKDWFPGSSGLKQIIPCYKCLKLQRKEPFEFKIEECHLEFAQSNQEMVCEYFEDDPSQNHSVTLENIVPDLLLQDIDPEFHLSPEDIQFNEDNIKSFLGKGAYGKVYKGDYKGRSVAVKIQLDVEKAFKEKDHKLLQRLFLELRNEAILLQKSHHPCLVGLIGVCLSPKKALVLEIAPKGSLDIPLLKKLANIHRLTIFRMATEVAAALQFLHRNGVVFRDLKAGNILVWTLKRNSLCHCKLTDFGIATLLAPCGVYSTKLEGTKGFIAPESFGKGEKKLYFVYDHKTDVFSFAMLLYQMIARRNPIRKDIAISVEDGERPNLQNISIAHSGYYYLTQLMQQCWEEAPQNRPSTEEIIKKLSSAEMQSIMCVQPLKDQFEVRNACPIISTTLSEPNSSSQVWVCSEDSRGIKVSVYETNTMTEIDKIFVNCSKVTSICLCGSFVWIAFHDDSNYGIIGIFNVDSRQRVYTVRMKHCSISCMCCSDTHVYVGTVDGVCLSFSQTEMKFRSTEKPTYKRISRHAISGIAHVKQHVWASHNKRIAILDEKTLSSCGSIEHGDHIIGQLSLLNDIVWSAHIGGYHFSAWDATRQIHSFDVNVAYHLQHITPHESNTLTCMVPALDTVWVGLESGHILVFQNNELLAWFHIYTEYVRFVSCIPCTGPSKMEKCMIISGATGCKSLFPGKFNGKDTTIHNPSDGTLVLWEAFDSRTLKQIKLIEQMAPNHLNNHNSVRTMIYYGKFIDGTNVMSDSWKPSTPMHSDINIEAVEMDEFEEPYDAETLRLQEIEPPIEYSIREYTTPKLTVSQAHLEMESAEQVVFDVNMPSMQHQVRVVCTKPVHLSALYKELAVNTGLSQDSYHVAYLRENNELVKITKQDHLEKCLKQASKPQLHLIMAGEY